MLEHELLRDKGILIVRPTGSLEAGDFRRLASEVDLYLKKQGRLTGLLIDAPFFPGWSDFAALIEHFRFVRDHHRRIARVAVATDSTILQFVPKIAAHFAHPEIKAFGGNERNRALEWLASSYSIERLANGVITAVPQLI